MLTKTCIGHNDTMGDAMVGAIGDAMVDTMADEMVGHHG